MAQAVIMVTKKKTMCEPSEYIEVKIKATTIMDRTIDKFFANIGGSTQQPALF